MFRNPGRHLGMIGLAAAALLAPVAIGQETQTATITNSGSTNRGGFRISVDASGTAEYAALSRRPGPGRSAVAQPLRRTLPAALVDRFFEDLNHAQPLGSLPPVHCLKSVSFGSVLTVAAGGEQTPDLSCGDGGNESMKNLIRDANEIVAAFQQN